MPVYTVHEPPRQDGDRDDDALAHAARFVFVRDGFHFWALPARAALDAAPPHVAGVHRLSAAARRRSRSRCARLGVAESAGLCGRAAAVACWSASRRRACGAGSSRGAASRNVGVVVGDDLEDAERRFFDGWAARDRRRRRAGAAAACHRRSRGRPRPTTSSACFRSRRRGRDRRDRRLRLGQPALGREGLRARRARVRSRSADPGDQRSRRGARAPTASCCPASAPSRIAGAGSMRSPAWSRR